MIRYFSNVGLVFCLSALCLFSQLACRSLQPKDFPKLYPVVLSVTQEGKPLAGATVGLASPDDPVGWTVGGMTDRSGQAILWTHGKFKGAPAGKFKVRIEKDVVEGEKEYLEAMEREDYVAAHKIKVSCYSEVEKQFESYETTPIEIEITKKSSVIPIEAGPAVRIKKEYLK